MKRHVADNQRGRSDRSAKAARGFSIVRPKPRNNGNGKAVRREFVVITGGAGFIGTNVADHFLRAGQRVLLFDNLSRQGVVENYNWLRALHGDRVVLVEGDVRNAEAVQLAVNLATHVFHFAAQVAVTTSLADPVHDFEVNARGTLNLLEAIRACDNPPPLLFTSTNKVYGDLDGVPLERGDRRYEAQTASLDASAQALRFCSPYGCSKGAADQYVLDYARTFDLPAVVLRMSCIYGPHQRGTEDQGWVAHFLINTLRGKPITVYGDGRQVRDVLFVDDLVRAMQLAVDRIDATRGQAFNIGGGPDNTTSLIELIDVIEQLHGERPKVTFDQWRTADQRYYVSDISRFSELMDWRPRIGVVAGVSQLYDWLRTRQDAGGHATIVREDACPR